MNYCMKCESLYVDPGTCNCFASGGYWPKVVPTQPVFPLGDTSLAPMCGACGQFHVPGSCPNATTTIALDNT